MSLEEYKRLIKVFVDGAISAREFRTRFVDTFLREPDIMMEELFWILQDLFEDAEALRQDWQPPGVLEGVLISEDELRQEAQTALDALERLSGKLYMGKCSDLDDRRTQSSLIAERRRFAMIAAHPNVAKSSLAHLLALENACEYSQRRGKAWQSTTRGRE